MKSINRIAPMLDGDWAGPETLVSPVRPIEQQRSVVMAGNLAEAPVVVIPVRSDQTPAGAPVSGVVAETSNEGIVLNLDSLPGPVAPALILGVSTTADVMHYAALEILATFPTDDGRVVVHGLFGGPGEELLQPRNLTPRFDFESMTFALGLPAEVLHQWEALGVLHPVALDRLLLCPRCHGLPTFRHGCRHCGSGRVVKTGNRLAMLAVGRQSDSATYFCEDCRWIGSDLVGVHQCLHCAHRFSPQQAYEMVLLGYHANCLELATASLSR
jgi:hypothetical protein